MFYTYSYRYFLRLKVPVRFGTLCSILTAQYRRIKHALIFFIILKYFRFRTEGHPIKLKSLHSVFLGMLSDILDPFADLGPEQNLVSFVKDRRKGSAHARGLAEACR
jgi:hypothetical protein